MDTHKVLLSGVANYKCEICCVKNIKAKNTTREGGKSAYIICSG